MPQIVLTEEQARTLAEAQGPVEVLDPQGRPVASLRRFETNVSVISGSERGEA